jgi:hypothetical protein
MLPIYCILLGIGALMVAVAVFNWDWWWYFDPESRLIEILGGENLVRWYWGISGLVIVVGTIVFWAKGG